MKDIVSDFAPELQLVKMLQGALAKGLQTPVQHGEFVLRVQFRDGKPTRFNTTIDESFLTIYAEEQQHFE